MTVSRMKYRLPLLLALVPASAAAQYVYTQGPNYVNMAGSSCRAAYKSNENNFYKDLGSTTKKAGGLMRVYCPIARRGTSFYGGLRESAPQPVHGSEYRVDLIGVTVRAADGSSDSKLTCNTFGARVSDQTLYFGATKTLCSSQFGCNFDDVAFSWTGWNTMQLAPPSGFNTVNTLNFGVTCYVPGSSTIQYLESAVTPNPPLN
jgi:hypothetical protein